MTDPIFRSEDEIGTDAENAMLAQLRGLSDLAPTSQLSRLARLVFGPEMAQLYALVIQGARNQYVQTASGPGLDRILTDFGLARPVAVAAWGSVRFDREDGAVGAIAIPAGHVVSARTIEGDRVDYAVDEAGTLLAGQNHVDALVTATQTGVVGNAGADAINEMTGGAIAGIASVRNPRAFSSGRDRGTDEETRRLFWDWLDARPRSTVAAMRQAALDYRDADGRRPVHSASIEEHLDAPGPSGEAVRIYVWPHGATPDGFDDPAWDALLDALYDHIAGYVDADGQDVEGWRAAGVPIVVDFAQIVEIRIGLDVELRAGAGAGVVEELRSAMEIMVASLGVGQTLTRHAIFGVIARFADRLANAEIVSPATDIVVAVGQKLYAEFVAVA